MKKVLMSITLMIVSFGFIMGASAATEDELYAYASQTFTIAGESVTVSSSNLVKLQRYLDEYDISEDDCDKIIAIGDQIISIMQTAGVSNMQDLSYSNKEKVLELAKEAVSLAGATLTYDNSTGTAYVIKDGKTLYDVAVDETTLVQTGADYTLASTAVLSLSLLGIAVYAKCRKNA